MKKDSTGSSTWFCPAGASHMYRLLTMDWLGDGLTLLPLPLLAGVIEVLKAVCWTFIPMRQGFFF